MKKLWRDTSGEMMLEVLLSIVLFGMLLSVITGMITTSFRALQSAEEIRTNTLERLMSVDSPPYDKCRISDLQVTLYIEGVPNSSQQVTVERRIHSEDAGIIGYGWK